MSIDPFEQGRRNQRDAEEEQKRQQADHAKNRKNTSQRLYSLLAPKVQKLGFAIWVEDDTLYIHPSKPERSYGSDRNFQPAHRNPTLSTMAVYRGGDFSTYENDLSDEDVLRLIGQYCEENKETPRRHKEWRQQREQKAAEDRRKWEASKRKEFWASNWGWFVVGFIVLLIISALG